MVPAGPDSGYDPDGMLPLEFKLWAGLRYNLAGQQVVPNGPQGSTPSSTVYAFGLFVSEHCSPDGKAAVEKQLSTVYLGCIH